MSTVVGNPVIAVLPLEEAGSALTGKASVLNALSGKGFRYCRLKTPAGTYSTIVPSGSWAEDGTTGVYRITVAASGAEGTYGAVIVYAEAGHAPQTWGWEEQVFTAAQVDPVGQLTTQLDDALTQTTTLNETLLAFHAGQVSVVSPVDAVTGDVTIEQGDDDTLSWTDAAWPVLTGATIALSIRHTITKVTTTASGTVDVATGSGKQVSVALDHAVTAILTPGEYAMSVKATIAGEVSTLVLGTFTVVRAS